jgi:nitrogen regulatory protein PII
MNLLFEKAKEVTRTLLPVVVLVLLLCFTVVDVETDIIIRFLVGSVMLLIGLSIFLWGVDLAMNPIGEHMSREVATSRTFTKVAVLSFLLGFLITVAEPDLLILGSQVQAASGDTLSSFVIVYMVSVGVGVMISLGIFRLLRDKPLNMFMAITYGVIFLLAFFVSNEFLAISFDASGATTGALTTPFVLALSLGLSKMKGGKHSEENSFGLVGIMSAGPILAVILMSIISGQRNIQGAAGEFTAAEGVLRPIINAFPPIFVESVIALLPITVLFFAYNYRKFKLPKDELSGIIKGLTLTLLGLVCFLTAVNSGFMDMGRIIGMEIAQMKQWVLVGIGFLLGLIVVLVEPAVHVLGEQIEEVTSGHIPLNLIRMTLSIGVGIAIALSMVRIVVPEVKLWYFLLPGFAIAILLSFKAEPVFVGIAYDAGGVASGPMTATFVLAFAQGAATVIETADVLVDGFGVIAMVAMAPVFSIMVLGTAFRHKKVEYPAIEGKGSDAHFSLLEEEDLQHNCIMAVVNRGFAEKVVDVARQLGATGATIIRGRGTGEHQRVLLPIINIELQPEKEIVILITGAHVSERIADGLLSDLHLERDGEVAVYLSPTEGMIKTLTVSPAD